MQYSVGYCILQMSYQQKYGSLRIAWYRVLRKILVALDCTKQIIKILINMYSDTNVKKIKHKEFKHSKLE